jgi:hypothetical protein
LNEEYKMKVALCLSVLMFSQPALVSPQTSNVSLPGQDWEKVKQVAANEELEVILKNGRKVRGRLVSATDSELWFSIKKRQPAPIKRDEVQNVWYILPSKKGKKQMFAGIGGITGFLTGVGVALSRMEVQCGDCTGEKAAMGVAIIGGLVGGALIGYKLGGRRQKILIFQIP